MSAAPETPDTQTEPHRLELHIIPPELFPDVAAVRRFFGSVLYQGILHGVSFSTTSWEDVPEPLRDEAGVCVVNLLYDLEALGEAVALPVGHSLCAEWKRDHTRVRPEERRRWLYGLIAAMAIDDSPEDSIASVAEIVECSPLDFGTAEDADDAA